MPVIAAVCGFVGFFTFVTPFLLHLVTKKYVTELHYNSTTDEYIATVISFFLTKKKIIFKTDDVVVSLIFETESNSMCWNIFKFWQISETTCSRIFHSQVPEVPGLFTSFVVNNLENKSTGLFIDPKLFEDPSHYVRIMGYDKPIDFKLDLKEKDK